jgi:predicted Holliday junction resolvase-like endonuclease
MQMPTLNQIKDGAISILVLVVGVLFFWNRCRNEEILNLKTNLSTANTQKKLDLIDAEVRAKLNEVLKSKVDLKELNELQNKIELKRKEIQINKSDQEILDYWNQ